MVWQSWVWKVVWERWWLTKFCVKDGVWKMVCERWWLTKMVWKMEVAKKGRRRRRRDTESKTRTPHKDVGNKSNWSGAYEACLLSSCQGKSTMFKSILWTKIRGYQQNPQPAPTKRHPGLLAKQKVSECFQTLPRPRPTRNWQKQVTSKAESHKNYSNVRPFSLACRLPMFSAFRPLKHFGHRGWSCMAGSSRNKSHSKA